MTLLPFAATLLCAVVASQTQLPPVLRERRFVVRHDYVQCLYHHGQLLLWTPRLVNNGAIDYVELTGPLRPGIPLAAIHFFSERMLVSNTG